MSEYDPAVELVDADGNPVGYVYYDTTNNGIAMREHGSEYELTLDDSGSVFVRQPGGGKSTVDSPWEENDAGELVPALQQPLNVGQVDNEDYHEKVVTGDISGTTQLDLSAANFFRHKLTGDVTFDFTNASSSPAGNSFTLIVVQDGTGSHAITWPAAVEWDSGSTPSLSNSAGDKHMIGFVSPDGGSTWIGVVSATTIA